MKKIISIESKQAPTFIVDWMLNDTCTYNCSYCPSGNKAGKEKWLTLDLAKGFIDQLEQHVSKQDVEILFTGGEPTIWANFVDLCQYIKNKGWKVSLLTNLVRNLDWWKQNWSLFTRVTYSYHSEGSNDSEFIEKLKWLDSFATNTQAVKVMVHPLQYSRCQNFINELSKLKNIIIVSTPIQTTFGSEQINIPVYTEEQLHWINNSPTINMPTESIFLNKDIMYEDGTVELCNPNKIILESQNNFKGWSCDAGLESIFILSTGDIFRATCTQGGPLGNIQDFENINWPTDPVICEVDYCSCYTDIRISKRSGISNT